MVRYRSIILSLPTLHYSNANTQNSGLLFVFKSLFTLYTQTLTTPNLFSVLSVYIL